MAISQFSLANDLTIDNSIITSNGTFTIWTSQVQNNNNNLPALRLIVSYSNPSPVDVNVTAIVESSQNGIWYPIAYQFNPFNNVDNGKERIIILQPDMNSINAGIDDDMYVGGMVVARTSRQQGKVGSSFRVRLVCYENNYGNQSAFQSLKVSVYGELFD